MSPSVKYFDNVSLQGSLDIAGLSWPVELPIAMHTYQLIQSVVRFFWQARAARKLAAQQNRGIGKIKHFFHGN